MKSAIIGGSGCQQIVQSEDAYISLETPYGSVDLFEHQVEDDTIYLLLRHGKGHTVPPHRINYRAQIAALRSIGVTYAIGLYAVGSITSLVLPGTIGMIDQFIDFTGSDRVSTFYDGSDNVVRHVPMVHPFSHKLRTTIAERAAALHIPIALKGTYVCTNGPRLETPAEIAMFRKWGADVVGMTAATETILAKEAGIHFAGLVYSVNWAAGLDAEGFSFIEEEIAQRVVTDLNQIAQSALLAIPG
jgi:purine nucleoside phosphorylase